jgi:hypothetical protein
MAFLSEEEVLLSLPKEDLLRGTAVAYLGEHN